MEFRGHSLKATTPEDRLSQAAKVLALAKEITLKENGFIDESEVRVILSLAINALNNSQTNS